MNATIVQGKRVNITIVIIEIIVGAFSKFNLPPEGESVYLHPRKKRLSDALFNENDKKSRCINVLQINILKEIEGHLLSSEHNIFKIIVSSLHNK